ncbi:hypothetical protein HPB50_012744 [Hyalomma asiaticum]|uniref:Uncharacterized protein n=1 Tax=Hyalomma asiaticum TaxID=266040 RepID=A0ACB7TJB0_HYAAI|nr:hypothetical protein HPB50_012744 [Hyalomma asiaticum]
MFGLTELNKHKETVQASRSHNSSQALLPIFDWSRPPKATGCNGYSMMPASIDDRTPSQLLRHMQQLLGDKVEGLDSLLLREIFLQKILPNDDLSKLAELADKIITVAPTSVAAVTSIPSPHEELQEMNEIDRVSWIPWPLSIPRHCQPVRASASQAR